jgi:putative hydrolase
MTRPPFGFNTSGGGEDEPARDPLAGLSGMFGGAPDLGALLHQLGDLMSGQTGPVNWNLAKQSALQALTDDPGTTSADTEAVAEAIRIAEVWLDPHTALPSGVSATEAWSRRRWLEATLPAWGELVDPVAGKVVEAMGSALPQEAQAVAGALIGVMRQVGGLMFGAQVGQALAALAGEVVSATEVGVPLGPPGRAALLPANVAALGEGLEVPLDELRIFLALREAAHHRLFVHVPWLRRRLYDAVADYGRGIQVDTSALESAMREVDPQDPESLQRALAGGMFEPRNTPEQEAALARLETLLALVEGWVDEVTMTSAGANLPHADALRETLRRRRASGGPAEHTFATLVGLELRPRRLREAAALWHALGEARGADGRDAVWGHPDLLPTGADLDDPEGFAARRDEDVDRRGLEEQ